MLGEVECERKQTAAMERRMVREIKKRMEGWGGQSAAL